MGSTAPAGPGAVVEDRGRPVVAEVDEREAARARRLGVDDALVAVDDLDGAPLGRQVAPPAGSASGSGAVDFGFGRAMHGERAADAPTFSDGEETIGARAARSSARRHAPAATHEKIAARTRYAATRGDGARLVDVRWERIRNHGVTTSRGVNGSKRLKIVRTVGGSCLLYAAMRRTLIASIFSAFVMAVVLLGTARTASATEVGYGRKFGLGFMLGDPTGLTAKLWVGPTNSHRLRPRLLGLRLRQLPAAAAVGPAITSATTPGTFNVDYLWQSNIVRGQAQLDWHIGAGGRAIWYGGCNGDCFALAARMPVGLDLMFTNPALLEVFFEIAPALYVVAVSSTSASKARSA